MIEKTVYANMKWWEVDFEQQPSSLLDLPPEFKKSYDLYYENAEKNFTKIVNLLEPFLYSVLIIEPDRRESPEDPDDLFVCEDDVNIESYKVRLVGVDFEVASPLPAVKTEALFKVPFVDNIDDIDPEDQCDMLAERFWNDVSLTFAWNLPAVWEERIKKAKKFTEYDDLELWDASNQGIDAIILEGDTFD